MKVAIIGKARNLQLYHIEVKQVTKKLNYNVILSQDKGALAFVLELLGLDLDKDQITKKRERIK
jgi:hypothetical protein